MTRIDKMDGYEIHHPFSKLQAKVKREGGLSLAEIEKRMSVRMAHLTEEFLAENRDHRADDRQAGKR